MWAQRASQVYFLPPLQPPLSNRGSRCCAMALLSPRLCVAWLKPNVDSVELPARGASAWTHMTIMRKGHRASLAVSGVTWRGWELAALRCALPETPLPLESLCQTEPAQGAYCVHGQTVRKTLKTGAGIWTHGYTHMSNTQMLNECFA